MPAPRIRANPPTEPTMGPIRLVWLLLDEAEATAVGVMLASELDDVKSNELVDGTILELVVIGMELVVTGTLDRTLLLTTVDDDTTTTLEGALVVVTGALVVVVGNGDGVVVVAAGAFVVVVVAGSAFVVVLVAGAASSVLSVVVTALA
jgi:hypothetical protein